MFKMEPRIMIEALRSGVPSKTVGRCFSEARQKTIREVSSHVSAAQRGQSSGMVVKGKYGEGKTHLLQTVAYIADSQNMVVSSVSLSKEAPLDKLHLIYQKLLENTFLPQHWQPGFARELEGMAPNSPEAAEMLSFSSTRLETNKLHFVLRAYLNTDEPDEKFQLLSDLEGDFIAATTLKKIYRRLFGETLRMNVSFSKAKHCGDYLSFMSHLFRQLGYTGWVILFDETELMGRLGKKTRLNAYQNMARFLTPPPSLENTFTLFALSSSYEEDVIEGKREYENLPLCDDPIAVKAVLDTLVRAPQLLPLTRDELASVFSRIRDLHGEAYDWQPLISVEQLMNASMRGGFLLRTRIRAAIEQLDQLYQYGQAGDVEVREVREVRLEEENGESGVSSD